MGYRISKKIKNIKILLNKTTFFFTDKWFNPEKLPPKGMFYY